jgi:hypothetical protein
VHIAQLSFKVFGKQTQEINVKTKEEKFNNRPSPVVGPS